MARQGEKQRAEEERQGEALVEVQVGMSGLENDAPPSKCCSCRRGAVAVMVAVGLVATGLVLWFVLNYFICTSTRQEEHPLVYTTKLYSSGPQDYDVFRAERAADYLVYGWVLLSDPVSEDMVLRHTLREHPSTVEKKRVGGEDQVEVSFFSRVTLSSGSKVSLRFRSNFTESLFHVYQLPEDVTS